MALKSTIYKAVVDISDIDHGHYEQHSLTLACHPSETEERMMVRLAAFALKAHTVHTECQGTATLGFGAGLSDPDDPDLRLADYTGRTRLWIEVGQPDERALTRASSRSDRVCVYAFSASADVWWSLLEPKLPRQAKLEIWRLQSDTTRRLATLAGRSMSLQATIQDGVLMIGNAAELVTLEPERLV
jgi:uncharacterized protein YaeQ